MNYFSKEKKAYKKEVKKVKHILEEEPIHLVGKGIPKPVKIGKSLKPITKVKRVFKR